MDDSGMSKGINADLLRGVFNGSIDKLRRIDELIKDCSHYAVNEDLRGLKHNLRELFRESYIFLSKDQQKKAHKDWDKCENIIIQYGEDGGVKCPVGDYLSLNKFFFFITTKLDKKGVTWAIKDMRDGFDMLKTRYGI